MELFCHLIFCLFAGRPGVFGKRMKVSDVQYVDLIFGFLFISGFAGLLPVVSWVLQCNSLIINTIHFSGMMAFSGWVFVWGH